MSRGWGGLEMASFQWARIFDEHHHVSHSICYPDSPLAAKLRQSKLKSHEMAFKNYFSPLQSLELRKYIVQNGIEAVFLQSLKDLWVVSPALIGLDCKLIGFAQMWLQGINKKDFLHTLIHKRMDLLITLTPRQGAQVLRCIPYPPEKTRVIPNSINSQKFSSDLRDENLRAKLGAKTSDILIGLVGRLDPQKGQQELIEAFAKCKITTPDLPLKLVLVGESTPNSGDHYLNLLRETIRKNNLENDVTLAGFRSDIPAVMASLDVFVLNSYQEAFGFVLVEAMASGTAVIATNSGGVPDILHEGRYGWLVPPRDITALAHTLQEVCSQGTKRRDLAKKAQIYARDEFDETKNYKKLLTYIEELP
jgi:glycosyltransferase involved in cell wall biosynthesis